MIKHFEYYHEITDSDRQLRWMSNSRCHMRMKTSGGSKFIELALIVTTNFGYRIIFCFGNSRWSVWR